MTNHDDMEVFTEDRRRGDHFHFVYNLGATIWETTDGTTFTGWGSYVVLPQ